MLQELTPSSFRIKYIWRFTQGFAAVIHQKLGISLLKKKKKIRDKEIYEYFHYVSPTLWYICTWLQSLLTIWRSVKMFDDHLFRHFIPRNRDTQVLVLLHASTNNSCVSYVWTLVLLSPGRIFNILYKMYRPVTVWTICTTTEPIPYIKLKQFLSIQSTVVNTI